MVNNALAARKNVESEPSTKEEAADGAAAEAPPLDEAAADDDIDNLLKFIEGEELPDDQLRKKKKGKKKKKASAPPQLNQELDSASASCETLQLVSETKEQVEPEREKGSRLSRVITGDLKGAPGEAAALLAMPSVLPQPGQDVPDDDDDNVATHLEEVAVLKAELKDKEEKLQALKDSDQSLVAKKGEEMAALLSAVETSEEEKHLKMKQVAANEATIRELQGKNERLFAEIENIDEKLTKIRNKKKKLENYLDLKVCESKRARSLLKKEAEEIKGKIEALDKVKTLQPKTPELLVEIDRQIKAKLVGHIEEIDRQIEAKEKELECPICFDVASPPIFRCDELHIICSDCRPKVEKISQTNLKI